MLQNTPNRNITVEFVRVAGYFVRVFEQIKNKRIWEQKQISTLVLFHVRRVFPFVST